MNMLQYTNKEQGKKYTFIVGYDTNWIDNIIGKNLVFENNVYKKYEAELSNVSGELVVCSDLSKLDEFCKKIIQETYSKYQEFISKRDFKKEQWVYNILDRYAEQDKIIYSDERIIIVPNYTWNMSDPKQMHLLVFPTDKSLHSLRDLVSSHIGLLEHIKETTLHIIKASYGFDSTIIKMYIHYAPTTYHLHVHFVLVSNTETNSSVEYSHGLSTVITNLKIKSDYYQSIVMDKRI